MNELPTETLNLRIPISVSVPCRYKGNNSLIQCVIGKICHQHPPPPVFLFITFPFHLSQPAIFDELDHIYRL